MTQEELKKMRIEIDARKKLKYENYNTNFKDIFTKEEKAYIRWLVKGYEEEILGLRKEVHWEFGIPGAYIDIVIVPKIVIGDKSHSPISLDCNELPIVKGFHIGDSIEEGGSIRMLKDRVYTFEELGIDLK